MVSRLLRARPRSRHSNATSMIETLESRMLLSVAKLLTGETSNAAVFEAIGRNRRTARPHWTANVEKQLRLGPLRERGRPRKGSAKELDPSHYTFLMFMLIGSRPSGCARREYRLSAAKCLHAGVPLLPSAIPKSLNSVSPIRNWLRWTGSLVLPPCLPYSCRWAEPWNWRKQSGHSCLLSARQGIGSGCGT